MKNQGPWKYRAIKVHFIILLKFLLCQENLSFLGETIKIITFKEWQVHKVDVLKQNDHTKAWNKVLREEIWDWFRPKLELEPVFLVVNGDSKVLVHQFIDSHSFSFDLLDFRWCQVVDNAEICYLTVTFVGIFTDPYLLKKDADLVWGH